MSLLSPLYDGSFAGVSFFELFDGGFGIEPDRMEDVSITHIPGGDNKVTQSSGLQPQTLELPVGVEGAELTSLKGKVGHSGSLVTHMGTQTARCIGIKQVQKSGELDGYKAVLVLVMG